MRKMKDSGITWIKEIPETWNVQRGKNILTLMKRSPEGYDEVITCFRDGEVTLRSNRREDGFTFSDKEIGYQGIEKGDLVIHGMDGFAGAIGISDSSGKGSPVLVVCTTKNNPKFLMYYLRMLATQNVFVAMATGIRERSCDLRWNKIANLLFPIPTIAEQKQIADYLDEKCSKIDAIIARQEEIIEKLKEYKLSIITEAVTKGIIPDVEMRDSEVQWMGEIPKHWKRTTVARVATVVRGASPRPAGDPRFFNGKDVPWITVGEVTNGDGKYIEKTETFLTSEGAKHSRLVKEGTLLLSNSGATLGVPKVTKISGCINDGSVAFYDLKINQLFLLYIFRSRTLELRKQMQGYGQPNLNTEIVKGIEVTLPPEREQEDIVRYLDYKCDCIENYIREKEKVLQKLDEYKKSLIYEVVTGKKEV